MSRRSSRAPSATMVRTMATDDKKDGKNPMPFGLGKVFGVGEPDNLVPTDRDHKTKKGSMPEWLTPDVKKDMEELGLDSIEDLDELEERNIDGYNDMGLVPPEGTGTFASPILIPSRRASRVVGYLEPKSHSMMWFTIQNDNNTYYIPHVGLFFKMLHIPDEEGRFEILVMLCYLVCFCD
mgnify:CR=1 FL=1